jgi:hypothetical protein
MEFRGVQQPIERFAQIGFIERRACDANDWFHARIVVAASTAAVFVADANQPSLQINLLNNRRTGLVGLWVGNNSAGDFANLVVVPDRPR